MSQRVLHISDCHLVVPGAHLLGVDTQAALEAVLADALADTQADAIIASGDIAHDPTRDVYQRFHATLGKFSDAPVLCLPGNHDLLGMMQAADLPMAPLELGAWSIVALDSHEDDAPRARITPEDRQRTAAALSAARGQFCLVATHHPLVPINSPWLDKDRIQNAQELIEWLSECSAIDGVSRLRSVVFGHAHQIVESMCAALPVYGVPSTCFQFLPGSERFTLDTLSPGYRWLVLADDGDISTQVHRVDSFPIHVRLNTESGT